MGYFLASFIIRAYTIFGLIVSKMLLILFFQYVNLVIYSLAFCGGNSKVRICLFSWLVVWFLSLINSCSLKHTLSLSLSHTHTQSLSQTHTHTNALLGRGPDDECWFHFVVTVTTCLCRGQIWWRFVKGFVCKDCNCQFTISWHTLTMAR